jgi:hypothetical protein
MSLPIFVTQEENLQLLDIESRDKEGFPQLPISSAARAFCDLTAPTKNKVDIKVRAHYRRRPFKITKMKKPKQCTLQRWFSSSAPPKQPARSLGSNKQGESPKKNPHQESTTNNEKEDRSFAISLHIEEMRDVLAASCNVNHSPPL